MMPYRPLLASFVTGITVLATSFFINLPAEAATEKWTNKDGKAANLEFVRLTEKDGEEAAEFKMTNGRAVTIKLSALSEADAQRAREASAGTDAGTAPADEAMGFALLDVMVKKVKAGQTPTSKEKGLCQTAFLARQKELYAKYDVSSNTGLPPSPRLEYFISAMKMSLIDFGNHGGWPTESNLRLMVLDGLKKEISKRNDNFVRFCAVFPALDGDDEKFAVECYRKLEKEEPYLAERIAEWLYGYYHKEEVMASFVKATGIRPPVQKSGQSDDAADTDNATFIVTQIHPLLKQERFDEAVALVEKRNKDNPSLPQDDMATTLAQIAMLKGVAIGDVDYTVKYIENLRKRFPNSDLRMPGLREMVEKQIKAREEAGGGGEDEVSPPE